jgi:CBS domain containing-hemolysin-like protein
MTDTPENQNEASWLGKLLGRGDDGVDKSPGEALTERMVEATEKFHTLRVQDVMVPRADIIAVDAETGLHDLSRAFEDAGHSRLPVYKDTLDEPMGFVHIKDLLPHLMLNARGRAGKNYKEKKILKAIRRAVLFVPPSMLARDLLRRMQVRRIHMAIVVDEYGGTDGIVTLEDLLEPIVGDIEDEHDGAESTVEVVGTVNGVTVYEADARIGIDDFEDALGREFATPDEEDDVDTLGGLVFTLAGRVPERGEIVRHPDGVEFEIMDADPRRVKRLRIRESDGPPKT